MRSLLAMLLLFCSLPAWAEVRASLDRQTLTAADVLTLQLEATEQIEQRPDLTPLESDFRILGSRRVIISSHSSASRAVRTRWELQLRPRATGVIRIPPLRLGDQLSQPLEVRVIGPLPPERDTSNLFMDSLISQDQVYARAQLLYTARVFHTEPLPESARFAPPQLDQARIIPLTELRRYDTDRGGVPWQITEQTFAIFPTTEGLHTLLGARLILDENGNSSVSQSSPLLPERFEIEVLPPAYQTSRGYWLPAERLVVEELTPLPDSLQPGESFIRELRLTALGLPAEALPPLPLAETDAAFIHAEDVSFTETPSPQGLVSTRTERILVEPLGEGELTLPAVDLHWWNTLSDRGQILTLPAQTLTVSLAAPAPAAPAAPGESEIQPGDTGSRSRLLIMGLGLICMITSLGWLYTWHQLRQMRSQRRAVSQEVQAAQARQLQRSHLQAERNTFQALAMACQQNDALSARQRLLDWGQHFWAEQPIDSLSSLCEAANSQTLNFLILDLEHHLRHEPTLWQGDLLLEALDTLRQRRMGPKDERELGARGEHLMMVS